MISIIVLTLHTFVEESTFRKLFPCFLKAIFHFSIAKKLVGKNVKQETKIGFLCLRNVWGVKVVGVCQGLKMKGVQKIGQERTVIEAKRNSERKIVKRDVCYMYGKGTKVKGKKEACYNRGLFETLCIFFGVMALAEFQRIWNTIEI